MPDSSWFTNRIGAVPVGTERVQIAGRRSAARPLLNSGPSSARRPAGANPGFTARDANGETWFLHFDPPARPEGATAAVVIATKLFWALGYNQVETFLTTFDPARGDDRPEGDDQAARPGARTPFTRDDLTRVLEPRGAATPTAPTASSAGRLLPGKMLGGFRYDGTRPDDPNDIVPHEHRRELRALRVFGAWTNLTDLKAGNTLDTLVDRERPRHRQALPAGRRLDLRHGQRRPRVGHRLGALLSTGPSRRRAVVVRLRAEPVADRAVHRVSVDRLVRRRRFDPTTWKPQTPTTAYMELRADDAFWAARRVMAFTDDLIRAAVHAGQFSDPAAERHLAPS